MLGYPKHKLHTSVFITAYTVQGHRGGGAYGRCHMLKGGIYCMLDRLPVCHRANMSHIP